MLPSFPCRISWVPRQSGLLHCQTDMRKQHHLCPKKTDRKPCVTQKVSLYADDFVMDITACEGFRKALAVCIIHGKEGREKVEVEDKNLSPGCFWVCVDANSGCFTNGNPKNTCQTTCCLINSAQYWFLLVS